MSSVAAPTRDVAARAPRPETLAGLVERVTFHNPENGFCVLRVKVRGQRALVTLVGHAALVSAGEAVEASGAWVVDRTHGLQFRAARLQVSAPTTMAGIERYLASGLIRGVGPVHAGKLVKAFGEAVFEVIERRPGRLREVEGVGPRRAERIVAAFAEQRVVREIMLFLYGHGVGTARAVRIYKTYGPDSVRMLQEDPYRLARDISGVGFRTADQIAANLGIESDAAIRVRAGISHALAEAMGEGHLGLPTGDLVRLAGKLLGVGADLVEAALADEIAAGRVVADRIGGAEAVFLTGLHRAEGAIAHRLMRLAEGAPPWEPIDSEAGIAWAEASTGIALAPSQREALDLALGAKVLVITGGPGVGKTTLVAAILEVLAGQGARIVLAAPTGRAAKRLSDSTGREARTLHRLLEADPENGGFRRDAANPIEGDLVVVDEASMVDTSLMHALLKAVPEHAALLLVGDVDQLPSVGPGQILADVINSGAVPVVRLTEVFRQAARSRIIRSAHRINRGLLPDLAPEPDSDFYFVEAEAPEDVGAKVLKLVAERIPRRFGLDPITDVQVLCPMNRGGLGARSLNVELQRALNPPGLVRVERFGQVFGPGDKVMQVENDYDREVYNGDLGRVRSIDPEAGELTAEFDGRPVVYGFGELDQLVLAYATTIHKAQGSEYPAVVIPVSLQHYTMLRRNLVYTGITRGRRLVVLVGSRRALGLAVRGRPETRRWSRLEELLRTAR